jgi:hypothetical protein
MSSQLSGLRPKKRVPISIRSSDNLILNGYNNIGKIKELITEIIIKKGVADKVTPESIKFFRFKKLSIEILCSFETFNENATKNNIPGIIKSNNVLKTDTKYFVVEALYVLLFFILEANG